MPVESYCSEAIILNVIPFQNYEQIMTVFTAHYGMVKLFCKKGKKNWQRFTPLTKVEVVFRPRNSELFACEEISPIENFLSLRKEFTFLEAGCDMVQSLLQSQMLGKESPLLYHLFNYYLEKIPEVSNLDALLSSFKLKILRHEGIFNSDPDSFSFGHLTKEESDGIHILAFSQNFSQICQVNLKKETKQKIDRIFIESL